MRVFSFVSIGEVLRTIEVELTLWPGLPVIQIIGMPDQHLKESIPRIKSAIKSAGFEFPKAQQIVVNLRPSHFRKTSRGLDLAIAAAFLWETLQAKPPEDLAKIRIYGELNLAGEVFRPADLERLAPEMDASLLTGPSLDPQSRELSVAQWQISNLAELERPRRIEARPLLQQAKGFRRPECPPGIRLSETEASLLKMVARQRLHLLLAGPAGSGKSTLAKAVHLLRPPPDAEAWRQLHESHSRLRQDITYYPLVKPHHSVPLHAMVGGGSTPQLGEISRAHGGILLLDELLEYRKEVLESLREPLEEKQIRVSRGSNVQTYPAHFQLVATTNLCPCGDYVPSLTSTNPKSLANCRYSYRRCRSYSERITGPLLDRFDVVHFMNPHEKRSLDLRDLIAEMELVNSTERLGRNAQESGSGSLHEERELPAELEDLLKPQLGGLQLSQRRLLALEKVARALRALDSDPDPNPNPWQRAMDLTILPFEKLRRWEI